MEFVFPEDEIADTSSVEITFSYAFAGTAGNPAGDLVEVFLYDFATGESTPSFEIATLAPSGVSSVTYELTGEDLASLSTGASYNLVFQLYESGETFSEPNFTNTAFGFDDVVVDTGSIPIEPGGTPIPFEAEFSSAAILLMLGGFWGFSRLKQRTRKAS